MLKLKELKEMVPETGKMDRVPTYKKLRESGHEIVVKEVIDQDTEVIVYDNGSCSVQELQAYHDFSFTYMQLIQLRGWKPQEFCV